MHAILCIALNSWFGERDELGLVLTENRFYKDTASFYFRYSFLLFECDQMELEETEHREERNTNGGAEGVGAAGRHCYIAEYTKVFRWRARLRKDGFQQPFAIIQTSKFPNGALLTLANEVSHLIAPRKCTSSSSFKWHVLPNGVDDIPSSWKRKSIVPDARPHIGTLRISSNTKRPFSLLLYGVRYVIVAHTQRKGYYTVFQMLHAYPSSQAESDFLEGHVLGGVVFSDISRTVSSTQFCSHYDVPDLLASLIAFLVKCHYDVTAKSALLVTLRPKAVLTASVSAFVT